MTHVTHPGANRTAIDGKVGAKDACRPTLRAQQTGAQTKHRGLASTIGALQEDRLASVDSQRSAGERGKTSQQHHYIVELDHGHI